MDRKQENTDCCDQNVDELSITIVYNNLSWDHNELVDQHNEVKIWTRI